MADATRFKDVLEAQKKTDQLLQADSLKRDAVEARLQEQIQSVGSQISDMGAGFDTQIQGELDILEPNTETAENCWTIFVVVYLMLGHLPRLKSLYLSRLSNVKSMGSSFYGIKEDDGNKEKIMVFPSLEKLELTEIQKLQKTVGL